MTPGKALRLGLFVLFCAGTVWWHSGSLHATHEDYRFKWPFRPGATATVNTPPYQSNHACPAEQGVRSCDDAWDLGISDGQVVSASEGAVAYVEAGIPANTCVGDGLGGLGNQVRVDLAGFPQVQYGHLAMVSSQGAYIYQGDSIGTQGGTGSTRSSVPGQCGIHLHWEFTPSDPGAPSHPSKIDGVTSPPNIPPTSTSSNSLVGSHLPGIVTTGTQAIRDIYKFFGAIFGSSWAVFGWTADWTGNQGGCWANTYCQYYVHYAPDTIVGHWGLRQTFRLHPGTPIADDGAIAVGRWTWNGTTDPSPNPYWIKPGFFSAWLGSLMNVGLPLNYDVGTSAPYCSSSVGCVAYQRFHLGYIWKHSTLGWRPSVFCADVINNDNGNHVRIDDILAVSQAYFLDDGPNVWEPWAQARLDTDGDGFIRVSDMLPVIDTYFDSCYPT